MQYVVVDIEALGLSINSRIIQLSACLLNPETLDIEKQLTYNIEDYGYTEISLPTFFWIMEHAQHLLDVIKDKSKIPINVALDNLSYFLNHDHILIGWNVYYDYMLLKDRFKNTAMKLNYHIIDLHTLAFYIMRKPTHLKDALDYFGIDYSNYKLHTAHDDAFLEAKLFQKMMRKD